MNHDEYIETAFIRKAGIPIHRRNAARKTDVLCPRHNPTRYEATRASNGDHLLLNLLPDSRHSEKCRRSYFFHRVTQRTLHQQTLNHRHHHPRLKAVFQAKLGQLVPPRFLPPPALEEAVYKSNLTNSQTISRTHFIKTSEITLILFTRWTLPNYS